MTEFELWELYLVRESLALEYFMLFGTSISAYVLVAYYIGERLPKAPIIVITALFLTSSASAVMNIHWKNLAMREIREELGVLQADALLIQSIDIGLLAGATIAVLLSLWYMWSVRHPKTE